MDMGKEIELKIYSIATSLTESIIFLDEEDGIRILPIWIGPSEAQAIAIKMSGYPSPRPMTHDLIYSIIRKLGCKIEKIVINDMVDNTYYATIHLTASGGNTVEVDARPSDAIAMAVRFAAPIFANEIIFSKSQTLNKPISEEEVVKFRENLKNLKPGDIINNPGNRNDEDKEEK